MKEVNKSQLGKGLSALLGSNSIISSSILDKKSLDNKENAPIEPASTLVDINLIKTNKDQPRKIFKDRELIELSNSIKESGIIQPLTVNEENGQLLLIAGERRLRAAKLAGLKNVPVVIKRATKKETLIMSIVENVQRSDLNCIEEALAYYQLMTEFNLTQEEVAKKIGKERSTIANFLRILKLPREVVNYLQKEELSFGHGKVLAALSDDEQIKRLANEAVINKLSVRDLEAMAKMGKKKISKPKNKFFDEKLDIIKQNLEKKTGYHFDLKTKSSGAGMISIKFNNEAEFNDIYTYLISKR
jgi:ParB family chromosome partitioning protein